MNIPDLNTRFSCFILLLLLALLIRSLARAYEKVRETAGIQA